MTAWALLAFVVAIAKASDFASAAFCLGLVLIFVGTMFVVIRPNLPRWLAGGGSGTAPAEQERARHRHRHRASLRALDPAARHPRALRIIFAGLVMPTVGEFRNKLGVRIENISSVLLLPVFFAFSGLRTEIGLLHGRADWLICLLIIGVATVGKLGGSSPAARFAGTSWREALQIGALMNTRGLMELIALILATSCISCRSGFSACSRPRS